jgi:NADPH:quinone reductase-like Zn-dependent oxidoreductase
MAWHFLVNHANDGTVRANVSLMLALSQAAEAHRLLEERQVVGAVVLDPRR